MEVPIYLAIDTTERLKQSTVALGESELAIEIHTLPNGSRVKYLLVGDGYPIAGNVERLRAPPEFIAELPARVEAIVQSRLSAETQARLSADQALQADVRSLQLALGAETLARQADVRSLQLALGAETLARQQEYSGWQSQIQTLVDVMIQLQATIRNVVNTADTLQAKQDELEYILGALKDFVELNHGPLSALVYALVTEDGDYIVTEEGDYIVV